MWVRCQQREEQRQGSFRAADQALKQQKFDSQAELLEPHRDLAAIAAGGEAGVEQVEREHSGHSVAASWQRQLCKARAAHAQVVQRDSGRVAPRHQQVAVAARGAEAGAARRAAPRPPEQAGRAGR
jgi:hypothetical protein